MERSSCRADNCGPVKIKFVILMTFTSLNRYLSGLCVCGVSECGWCPALDGSLSGQTKTCLDNKTGEGAGCVCAGLVAIRKRKDYTYLGLILTVLFGIGWKMCVQVVCLCIYVWARGGMKWMGCIFYCNVFQWQRRVGQYIYRFSSKSNLKVWRNLEDMYEQWNWNLGV